MFRFQGEISPLPQTRSLSYKLRSLPRGSDGSICRRPELTCKNCRRSSLRSLRLRRITASYASYGWSFSQSLGRSRAEEPLRESARNELQSTCSRFIQKLLRAPQFLPAISANQRPTAWTVKAEPANPFQAPQLLVPSRTICRLHSRKLTA